MKDLFADLNKISHCPFCYEKFNIRKIASNDPGGLNYCLECPFHCKNNRSAYVWCWGNENEKDIIAINIRMYDIDVQVTFSLNLNQTRIIKIFKLPDLVLNNLNLFPLDGEEFFKNRVKNCYIFS